MSINRQVNIAIFVYIYELIDLKESKSQKHQIWNTESILYNSLFYIVYYTF